MNPYFFHAIMQTLQGLKRECPKCGRTQAVSARMKDRTVVCKFCGAEIPPKRKSR
jgi:uncharacterized protein (DUF983 family)